MPEELDKLFAEYQQNKDIKTLDNIAKLLKASKEQKTYTKDQLKTIKTMQDMRLIGKSQEDGSFSRGEIERTNILRRDKNLDNVTEKTSGSATGAMFSDENNSISYMVKYGTPIEHLVEVTGARFYNRFAGKLGNITAKTRLFETGGQKHTGSRMFDNYQHYYNADKTITPKITEDGRVSSGDKEIKGYIATLVTAKFLHDWDAVGYGPNSGILNQKLDRENERNLYPNAKIDPGNSLSFIPRDSDYEDTSVALGISTNLKNNISKHPNTFHTNPALDFIDPNDVSKLRPELGAIKTAIETIYPGFDNRDLLMGEMTYKEISAHPKPYKQMAKTIEAIVKTSDEELQHLIYSNIPEQINGMPVKETQEQIFKQLKTRRDLMAKLYAPEVEYMKLYREAKNSGEAIDFEGLKTQAKAATPRPNTATIKLSEALKEEINHESKQIAVASLISEKHKTLGENMLLEMTKNNKDISYVTRILPEQLNEDVIKSLSKVLIKIKEPKQQEIFIAGVYESNDRVKLGLEALKLLSGDKEKGDQLMQRFGENEKNAISSVHKKAVSSNLFSKYKRRVSIHPDDELSSQVVVNIKSRPKNNNKSPSVSDVLKFLGSPFASSKTHITDTDSSTTLSSTPNSSISKKPLSR
jgi:hypothetical protein